MPWYKEGLRFKCTGCGQCCTGEPGYVWLTADEIDAMAKHLHISTEEFIKKYTRSIFGRFSLREDHRTYDCIFLKDKRCQIYHVRPTQCKTFPWWKENINSPESWKEVERRCEGVNHPEAPVVPAQIISHEVER